MTQEPKLFPYITRLLQGASVEWKPLGEVAELKRGRVISKEYLYENAGEYPVYSSQTVNNGEIGKIKTFDFDQEAITWTTDGANAGTVFYREGRFSITNVCGLIKIRETEILNYKFLYYWLSIEAKKYVYSGMGNPKLMSNQIAKIPIPLPPISVQREIVRILDKFTTLETELETELDCRKRQYEYYRNHLLTFGDEVEWKALGEVVKTTKNIKWQNNENTYDYIDLTSVCRETGNVLETLKIKADNAPSRAQKMVQLDDVIFATTRPSQMRIALIPKKFDGQIASTGYCVLRADKVNVLPKWIFFTLSTTEFKKFVAENQSGTAYPAISDSKLKEFKIPLPPLSEQQRIATILDKFDTLVNSISEGLPREIELRRKQYEYYRDQLFPKT